MFRSSGAAPQGLWLPHLCTINTRPIRTFVYLKKCHFCPHAPWRTPCPCQPSPAFPAAQVLPRRLLHTTARVHLSSQRQAGFFFSPASAAWVVCRRLRKFAFSINGKKKKKKRAPTQSSLKTPRLFFQKHKEITTFSIPEAWCCANLAFLRSGSRCFFLEEINPFFFKTCLSLLQPWLSRDKHK